VNEVERTLRIGMQLQDWVTINMPDSTPLRRLNSLLGSLLYTCSLLSAGGCAHKCHFMLNLNFDTNIFGEGIYFNASFDQETVICGGRYGKVQDGTFEAQMTGFGLQMHLHPFVRRMGESDAVSNCLLRSCRPTSDKLASSSVSSFVFPSVFLTAVSAQYQYIAVNLRRQLLNIGIPTVRLVESVIDVSEARKIAQRYCPSVEWIVHIKVIERSLVYQLHFIGKVTHRSTISKPLTTHTEETVLQCLQDYYTDDASPGRRTDFQTSQ